MLLPLLAELLSDAPRRSRPDPPPGLGVGGGVVVVARDAAAPVLAYFPRAGAYQAIEAGGVLRLVSAAVAGPEDVYVPRPGTYRVVVTRRPAGPPVLSVRPV